MLDEFAHKKAAILLWLLERTNATVEDILDYGKSFLNTNSWEETVAALEKKVQAEGLWDLYENIELPLIQIIQEMHDVGIALDTNYLKTLSQKLHKELDALEKRIYKAAGKEFNLNRQSN